jgi:hypothetical protein
MGWIETEVNVFKIFRFYCNQIAGFVSVSNLINYDFTLFLSLPSLFKCIYYGLIFGKFYLRKATESKIKELAFL